MEIRHQLSNDHLRDLLITDPIFKNSQTRSHVSYFTYARPRTNLPINGPAHREQLLMFNGVTFGEIDNGGLVLL